MNEYVDVDIIENGKVIGTTKILKKTEEPEEQNIKLNKVDDKTAYQNLLIKCAELEADNRLLEQRGSDILKELLDKNKRCIELERQIEKMKCCENCRYRHCDTSTFSVDKDGNKTFHSWNEEKERYCDTGKNGKYQCWEIEK